MYFPAEQVQFAEPDSKTMCGDGRVEELANGPTSPNLRAKYVKFTERGYTKWHFHTGDQILVAAVGIGFVELRGRPEVTMRCGDRVQIPADTWHRHGAVDDSTFVHLAVTTGETVWEEDDTCERNA